jgi:sec-independent protein translocase protein TatA
VPNLGGWELVILLGVLVLVFGAKKLPDMARSVGQSARVFKGEMKGLKQDTTPASDAPAEAAAPAAPLAAGGAAAATPAAAPTAPAPASTDR